MNKLGSDFVTLYLDLRSHTIIIRDEHHQKNIIHSSILQQKYLHNPQNTHQ